jgi:multidrug transporter EmrE-like cation transporter
VNVHFLVILAALISVVGDLCGKLWAIGKGWYFYPIALVVWTLGSIVYLPVLAKQGLIIATLMWCFFNILGFVFLGVVVFKETLTPLQWGGVFLGITGMVLLTSS